MAVLFYIRVLSHNVYTGRNWRVREAASVRCGGLCIFWKYIFTSVSANQCDFYRQMLKFKNLWISFFVFVKTDQGDLLVFGANAENTLLRHGVFDNNSNANKQLNYNAHEIGSWWFIFYVYSIILCMTILDTEITLFWYRSLICRPRRRPWNGPLKQFYFVHLRPNVQAVTITITIIEHVCARAQQTPVVTAGQMIVRTIIIIDFAYGLLICLCVLLLDSMAT